VRVVRVFVSSPVDVAPERGRVQAVAAKLNRDYQDLVRFETVLWEEHFYKADRSFQPQIPEAVACDVLVSIFWTRVGTALPIDFAHMPDGRPYPSGTAYELLTALEASRSKGLPDVYVFRKTADAVLPTADADRRRQGQVQLDALEAFWAEWFKSEQGHFKAAFQTFASTDEFERQVELLLRQWLESHGLLGPRLKWPKEKGSPFRGLAPFEAEHAAVFFGRDRVIDEARRRLAAAAEAATPFLLIVGASGSGKSSLARAGLIPRLTTPGIVASVDIWRVAIMKPSEGQAGAIASLAAALLAALPELAQGDFPTADALADNLRRGGAASARPIAGALTRIAEAAHQAQRTDQPLRPGLVLLVDQLEELFAQAVSDDERSGFVAALKELMATGKIWCIATLRADLYELLLNQPALKALKETGASLDLGPPGAAELAEIVRAPAAAAGLVFETNAGKGALDERLLADANTADSLPLLQFTLRQLYERRSEVGDETALTNAAYDTLGGLQGAIAAEAERAVAGLPAGAIETLPRLLRRLAEPARDGKALTLREVAQSDVAANPAETALVGALLDARILVAGKDSLGRPTLRLAHDAVLASWPRAAAAAQASRDFYRVRSEVEDAQRRWHDYGKPADRLIQPGVPLAEAEKLAADFGRELPGELTAFISASRNRARARQRLVAAAAVFFFVLAVAATGAGIFAYREQQQAVRERERAEQTLAAATATANSLVFDLAQRFRYTIGIPAALIKDILDRARALQDELTKSGPITDDLKHSKAAALDETADSLLAIGDTAGALAAAQQASQIDEELLANDPGNPEWERSLSVAEDLIGDALVTQGNLAAALKIYQESLAIAQRLAKANPNSPRLQRDLSVGYEKVGNVQATLGNLAAAFKSYQDGLAIALRLAQSNPNDTRAQRDLSISYFHVGDVQLALGDLQGALTSFNDSLAVRERLAKSDPGNGNVQHDLAISYYRVGDVQLAQGEVIHALESYSAALAIFDQLAKSDASNSRWQRDLSVIEERIGDAQMARGDLASALKSYTDCETIRERLLKSDTGNADWQRDLATAYLKIGDVQTAEGDLSGALASYRNGLAMFRRLATSAPAVATWQRDVSVALNKVGDVQTAQGDRAGAIESYRASLLIAKQLAKSDPHNTDWQRDLSIALNKVGDAEAAQGDVAGALADYSDSLAIADQLAKSDPGNATWQRDLSVSYQKIGNVHWAKGELPAALDAYKEGLAILERLAKANSGNAPWQRDLSVAYQKVGDVQAAQGDLPVAVASYEASLAIIERLAKSDPANAGWQRDLSLAYNRLGDVHRMQNDLAAALTWYRKSLAVIEPLTVASPGNPLWLRDLSITLNKMGDVQLALNDVAAPGTFQLAESGAATALESFRKGLAAIEQAAEIDPNNAAVQRDISVSYGRIAAALRKSGQNEQALDALRRAQAIIERMAGLYPDNPVWKRDLAWIAARMAEITSAARQ
jgi:tetratricopeptide (TPR) repeat protein